MASFITGNYYCRFALHLEIEILFCQKLSVINQTNHQFLWITENNNTNLPTSSYNMSKIDLTDIELSLNSFIFACGAILL